MVREITGVEGAQDGVGVEWGVEWGLDEGEELPDDVEDLNEAQYMVWQFIKVIRGIGDDGYKQELERQKKEAKPSGLLVPMKPYKPN